MRIVLVLHSHTLGGAENQLFRLAKRLKNDGHEIAYAGPRDSWLADKLMSEGIKTVHIPMHGFYDIYSLIKLVYFLKKFKPDIVRGDLTRGAFYAGLAAKFVDIPSVGSAHSTNTWKHFKWVDKIITVSDAVNNFLKSKGYQEERLIRIYNGVDIKPKNIEDRIKIRQELGIAENEVVFGMISRIIHDKGHDIALEAFVKAGRPGKLVIVGDYNTDFGDFLMQKVEELNLNGYVIWTGQKDDVFPYLTSFDVFLAPSRREAMSLSIIEAMGMGLPIIGSKVGGNPEQIEHGKNGFLFTSENAEEMGQYMKILENDKDMRMRFGEYSKEKYLSTFSGDIFYRNVLNVFEDLIKEKKYGKN